ncbi:MAG: DedA family protein [Sporolactobacillus sp.]
MDTLIGLLHEYGYLVLFISLFLEMLALPLPNELAMSYVGYLVYTGKLDLWLALTAGIAGCLLGTTATYWCGRKLGAPFFRKIGPYVHLTPERMDKMSLRFETFGKKLLLIANFIPGVRHLIGYAAGISRLNFRTYMVYAYIGGAVWVLTFISLGVALGPKYALVTTAAKSYFSVLLIIVLGLLTAGYAIKSQAATLKHWTVIAYRSFFVNVQSRFRLKLLISGAAFVCSALLVTTFNCLGHFFHYRALTFNRDGLLLLHAFLSDGQLKALQQLIVLTHPWTILIVCLLIYVWILLRGQQKKLELQMSMLLIMGGLIFSVLLPSWISRLISRIGGSANPFSPDSGLIMTFVLCAYFVYLVSRHSRRYFLTLLLALSGAALLLAAGVAALSLSRQLPSDLLIDYLLAGIWCSFIILCLELLRLIAITDRAYREKHGAQY